MLPSYVSITDSSQCSDASRGSNKHLDVRCAGLCHFSHADVASDGRVDDKKGLSV